MTTAQSAMLVQAPPAVASVDPTRWAVARGWAREVAGVLALGIAVPAAILLIGSPIAIAARIVIELVTRLAGGAR